MKMKAIIEGMNCGHCVNHVTEALSDLKGITGIQVSLENKCAEFYTSEEVTDADIKAAIEDFGYEVISISSVAV